MNHSQIYERFPLWIVILCNLVSWATYAIGAIILGTLWIWLVVPYLLYALWLEVRLLRTGCVDCVYYGRTCAFGKGRLCAMGFKPGDPRRFPAHEISWVAVLPDFLVSIFPLIGGIVLWVLRGWNWPIAGLAVLLLVLAFGGTGFVRGSLACNHCEQRETGCPAYDLFGGTSDG